MPARTWNPEYYYSKDHGSRVLLLELCRCGADATRQHGAHASELVETASRPGVQDQSFSIYRAPKPGYGKCKATRSPAHPRPRLNCFCLVPVPCQCLQSGRPQGTEPTARRCPAVESKNTNIFPTTQ
ncbi:hypothetical protein IF2G_06023 [Cordyceps javanica]|nr:hypothetical protein IF2G_06023 [Cordyceps javanica]